METHYSILGLPPDAGEAAIKKAFREKAKQLHPDIAGPEAETEMRKLLAAYKALLEKERRERYDRAYSSFSNQAGKRGFNYRSHLRAKKDDPTSQAKLIFFEFLHLEDDEAIRLWDAQGGRRFHIERYLDREDWMDCAFMLAEELEKRSRHEEAFWIFCALVREERREPYFRHFAVELEKALRELVRLKLKAAVPLERYVECLTALLNLGFPPKDEARWRAALAEALAEMGEKDEARAAPALPQPHKKRRD
ncbi:MAG: DnaJ domain-containing protein [Treponema sp.]|nr:DnaJ domain-containing protein [Treponema sp.]